MSYTKNEIVSKINQAFLRQQNSTINDICREISDELKRDCLQHLENDLAKATVIKSFESDRLKKDCLQYLENDLAKAFVIKSFESDELKKDYLQFLNDDFNKIFVIKSLKLDELKKDCLQFLKTDYLIAIIIRSFKSDELKEDCLQHLENNLAKATVIDSFKSDELKKDCLQYLEDDFAKAIVIDSFKSDEVKKDFLQYLEDDFVKATVITSFESDELRKDCLQLLHQLLNETYFNIGLNSNITIGIEIESEGESSYVITNKKKFCGWNVHRDYSLRDGVEITSPILRDTKGNVQNIYIICKILKKLGQTISPRCGGHIHIGADYLKSKEAYHNLMEIWGNTERILYIISNEQGNIPRNTIKKYATTISPKLNTAIQDGSINLDNEYDLTKFIKHLQKVQGERYSGINFLNINNGKNTIEFRLANGTLNPDTWIENARLFGRIIEISQKLTEIEAKTNEELLSEDINLLFLRDKLKEEIPEEEKMETLLKLLFKEEERKVYRNRYYTNTQILSDNKNNPLELIETKPVRLKKKTKGTPHHSIYLSHPIAQATPKDLLPNLDNVRTSEVNDAYVMTKADIQRQNENKKTENKNLKGDN